jgi:hypothetical protein
VSGGELVAYDHAFVRVVPHVHLGAFRNVGVIVHAPTREYLGIRVITAEAELARLAPGVDVPLLARYLRCYEQICAGDEAAGPLALASLSERFNWLTSPRSDVLQSSPVHEGLAEDPATELESLFEAYVRGVLEPGP